MYYVYGMFSELDLVYTLPLNANQQRSKKPKGYIR